MRGSPLTLTQEGKTMTKRGDDENETGRIEHEKRIETTTERKSRRE